MDVKAFFAALGWQDFGRAPLEDDAILYGLRVDASPCNLNDRLSIHATHYHYFLAGKPRDSVEFDITAEAPDGQWFALTAYSIPADDLTPELVESLKRRLIAAWEAVR